MIAVIQRIIRLLAHPSKLKKQAGMLADYLLFRMRFRFLATPFSIAPDAKKVLIVNLTDAPYHAQIEGLLARAMADTGGLPVVLTYKTNQWTQKYFRACGVTEFVFFDEYLKKEPHPDDEKEVRSFLSTNPSNEELLSYTYDGINIGGNALSVVLKAMRVGSIDLSQPGIEERAIQILASARAAVRASRTLLNTVKPAILIFTEPGYTPHGELFASALERGLKPLQYLPSQRLDALIAKRFVALEKMVDPVSVSPKSWEYLMNMPWNGEKEKAFMAELEGHYRDKTWFNFLASRDKKHVPPDELRRRLDLDPSKKTAVIFSHVVWDASFFYGKNLFDDYDHWLVETVKVAIRNTNVNWVIKLHPDYVWHTKAKGSSMSMRDLVAVIANVGELLPHIKIVPPDTDISTYSFFAVTDYCITVRGTVGLEFPCFGVTAFTAGMSRYSGLGFTENSESIAEYLQKMENIHTFPTLSAEKTTIARKHAYGLFVLRPMVCSSFTVKPVYRNDQVIDHELSLHARSLADVHNDPGLSAFASWALHSDDEDYLPS